MINTWILNVQDYEYVCVQYAKLCLNIPIMPSILCYYDIHVTLRQSQLYCINSILCYTITTVHKAWHGKMHNVTINYKALTNLEPFILLNVISLQHGR